MCEYFCHFMRSSPPECGAEQISSKVSTILVWGIVSTWTHPLVGETSEMGVMVWCACEKDYILCMEEKP